MAAKGARRKQKPHGSSEQGQGSSSGAKHDSQAASSDDSVGTGEVVAASLPESIGHFTRNYAGSVLFHAHLAFLPALLTHALRHSVFFSSWSHNAWTVLAVLVANASWQELLDNGCVTDPIAAFIAFRQEKQFCEVCGSKLNAARKTRWIIGGVSGFLGAVTVGLLIAAFSPVQPFGPFQPVPREVFSRLPREPDASPSLLTDVLRSFTAAESRVAIASSLKEWAQKTVSLSPLFDDPQHSLEKMPPSDFLQACSLLLDTCVAEFLCCLVFFVVFAVVTSASFYFELKHAGRIKLAVLIFAVASGLPYCGLVGESQEHFKIESREAGRMQAAWPKGMCVVCLNVFCVGGPMLGVSFSALVAGSRLDPWGFLLTALPACLAAVSATRLVEPVPLALAHVRKREEDVLKKNL
ncbi:hypothetical protein Emag_004965 [Eimeria magna]